MSSSSRVSIIEKVASNCLVSLIRRRSKVHHNIHQHTHTNEARSQKLNILHYILYEQVRCAASALTLLVGRQEGHLACKKIEWSGAGMVVCLERGADLHTAQLMPLPLTVFCFDKIQIGFTFLVPAHPCGPGQRAVKRVCVCVCGWRRGVVVSGVRRMNEVNARRARLVPGWVTVFGRVYHLGM